MADETTLVPSAGEVVAGKYLVGDTIGEGGMAVVVAATCVGTTDRVAIKILQPRYAASHELRERFFREGRALASLHSQHVARVFDVGTLNGGSAYIALEHLDGVDLHDLLQREGPLSEARAATYLVQVCAGLAEAHGLGILHRDLKPSNIFLVPEPNGLGTVKLLDFGLAKLKLEEGVSNLTAAESVMGSPSYMSPEQIRGLTNADERSDIWSLGVTLYELLTDHFPFEGETPTKIAAAVLALPPTPMRHYAPHISLEIEEVIMACLVKDVKKRVQSARQLSEMLMPFTVGTDGQSEAHLAMGAQGRAGGVATMGPVTAATLNDEAPTLIKAPGIHDIAALEQSGPESRSSRGVGSSAEAPGPMSHRSAEFTLVAAQLAGKRARRTWLILVPLILLVVGIAVLVVLKTKWSG